MTMRVQQTSFFDFEDDTLSFSETARIIGVSEATVRNWIKLGIIKSNAQTNRIEKHSIDRLRHEIDTGRLEKLNKRANKSKSQSTRNNKELGSHTVKLVDNLKPKLSSLSLNESIAVFAFIFISIKLDNRAISKAQAEAYRLACEVIESFSDLTIDQIESDFDTEIHLAQSWGVEDDFLGVAYQELLSVGSKSDAGSYYTPASIVEDMISDISKPENLPIVDPCCGAGVFLLSAAKKIQQTGTTDWISHIYGADIDPLAVRVAKISILSLIKDNDFVSSPNIYCFNSLEIENWRRLGDVFGSFKMVVSNPPWGSKKSVLSTTINEADFYPLKSNESFSYFVILAHKLLGSGGRLNYLLPRAFYDVGLHRDIRSFVVTEFNINKIVYFGNAFHGLMVEAVSLQASKGILENSGKIDVIDKIKNVSFCLSQQQIVDSSECTISLNDRDKTSDIKFKIKQFQHFYLGAQDDWALGIVTGDNAKHIHQNKFDASEPIYKGKDVLPFKLAAPTNYIAYTPENFQQCAKEHMYRAEEKLVYRFISDKLIFAVDRRKSLTLNSANIIIPRKRSVPIDYIAAFLNSCVANFLFKHEFGSIKVLRKHIESIPIPVLDENCVKKITDLAIEAQNSQKDLRKEIDEIFIKNISLDSTLFKEV